MPVCRALPGCRWAGTSRRLRGRRLSSG